MVLGGTVLLTGGTGFLSRGIMHRAQQEGWPARFVVLSRDETKQDQCKRKYPDASYVLGDIRDSCRVEMLFAQYDFNTVVHTAAIKYVPDAERNVLECIDVNIEGTRTVFQEAARAQAGHVVFISTDKACRPVNVYGMTKSLGERMLPEFAQSYHKTQFVGTRYGNVIGSTGSVIPYFEQLVREKKPIPVTDSNMTRFWMTLDEAVDCILESLNGESGTICIPKCRAASIGEVAKAVGGDGCQIDFVGTRPGEKTSEELVSMSESHRVTDGGKFYYTLHPISAVPASPRFSYTSDYPHEYIDRNELMTAYEKSKCV